MKQVISHNQLPPVHNWPQPAHCQHAPQWVPLGHAYMAHQGYHHKLSCSFIKLALDRFELQIVLELAQHQLDQNVNQVVNRFQTGQPAAVQPVPRKTQLASQYLQMIEYNMWLITPSLWLTTPSV